MDSQDAKPTEDGLPVVADGPSLRERLAKLSHAWALIGLIVLVNIWMNGLSFGHGDHYSHVAALRHFLSPEHLADDWYIQTLDNLNIRHFFVATVAPFAKVIGIPATLLLLQIAVITMMAWAFMMIGRYFFGEPACWWVSLVGVTAVAGEGLGFVSLWAYVARAQDVGHAMALLALAFWLDRRSLLAGLCLGLSIDFHPLLGAQAAVLLGIVHLLSRLRELKHLAALVIAAAIAAVPAFWLYLAAARAGSESVDMALLLDTHYFRVLGRADPLRWTLQTWAALLAFIVTFAATIPGARRELATEKSRDARWLLIVPAAVFLLAIPFGVFFQRTALFQPLRTGVWPRIAAWCLIGSWCHRRWREGGVKQVLIFFGLASVLDEWMLLGCWLLVLIVSADWKVGEFLRDKLRSLENYLIAVYHARSIVYEPGGQEDRVELEPEGRNTWRWFLVIAAVAIMAGAAPHWGKARPVFKSAVPAFPLFILGSIMLLIGLRANLYKGRHILPCALTILCLLSLRLPGAPLGPRKDRWAHIQPWLKPTNHEEVIATWCKAHLPPGVRLLVTPRAEAFRVHAEHPVVIDYKCFPFSPPDVLEWRRRMLEICDMPQDTRLRGKSMSDLLVKFNQQPPEKIERLARKYNAPVFITRSSREYPFLKLFRREDWTVYRLPPFKKKTPGADKP